MPGLTTSVTVVLLVFWMVAAGIASGLDRVSAAMVVAAAAVFLLLASSSVARFLPGLLVLLTFAPRARSHPDWRAAMWLIGVPWAMLACALAWPRLDEFTLFSRGDDWLTYQVSAYKIYLQGFWVEAGEPLFYYQPLYRWIAGALHLLFGDTSGGESLWDFACLLVGALLAFTIVRRVAGGRWAVFAAALTLVVSTITPIWYLIGRGLAEISAAGFAWTAVLLLVRPREVGPGAALAAGVFAVLGYFSRLNHMLFAGGLMAFLVPVELPARALREPRSVMRSLRFTSVLAYGATLLVGLLLLAVRAWYYTGLFSPFAGTSFGLNHTGLAPHTLLSSEVWQKVSHSVFSQMMANEVFDVRGSIVLAGCAGALLALAQVRGFSRLSLATSVALVSGLLGALVAHAHGYPGRFSVHLVPFACAIVVMALSRVADRHDPL
jgi:hypothetical protein